MNIKNCTGEMEYTIVNPLKSALNTATGELINCDNNDAEMGAAVASLKTAYEKFEAILTRVKAREA